MIDSHPKLAHLITSGSNNPALLLHDIIAGKCVQRLRLSQPAIATAWLNQTSADSPALLSTIEKDTSACNLRIYDIREMRKSKVDDKLSTANGSHCGEVKACHLGIRGARVVSLENDIIATIGYTRYVIGKLNLLLGSLTQSSLCRTTQREIKLFDRRNLPKGAISTIPLDASPSLLIPHFDHYTGLLYLSGRVIEHDIWNFK